MHDKKIHIINYVLQIRDEKLLDELEKLLSYAIKEQATFIPNFSEEEYKPLNGNTTYTPENIEQQIIPINGKEKKGLPNPIDLSKKLRENDNMMYLENIPED